MRTALAAGLAVANVTAAICTLGYVVQRSERSRFRYSLWRIRDELFDAVLEDKLVPSKGLFAQLDFFEVEISLTEWFTPFNIVTLSRRARRLGLEPPPTPEEYYGVDAPERALLADAYEKRSTARMRLFFLGSPSGWLALALTPFVAPILILRRRAEPLTPEPEPIHRPRQVVAASFRERYGSPTGLMQSAMRGSDEKKHHAYV